MIEINLIPDIKRELIQTQRARSFVVMVSTIVGVTAIIIISLLALYIFSVQQIRGNGLDTQITTENKTLSEVKDLSKMLTIQNQLTKISQINDNKKIDSRIFNLLDNISPPSPNNISISNVSVDSTEETISIDGQAIIGYSALETLKKMVIGAQIKYIDSDNKPQYLALADNVTTKDVSYGEDSNGIKVLRFTIVFNYAVELFAVDIKNPLVVITENGNVTDSYQGLPRSIFTDKATDIKEVTN